MQRLKINDYWAQLPTQTGIRAPKPFPGRWPTKLIIRAQWRQRKSKDWTKWEYFGKPSPNVIARIKRLMGKKFPRDFEGNIKIVEVDRSGPIRDRQNNLPYPFHGLTVSHWNERLTRFYHPWTWQHGSFAVSFEKFYLKGVLFQGKVYRTYSPFETLKLED